MSRTQVGAAAEERAAVYLREQGFRVLARNYRKKFGELDIVALTGDVLVFVEVRSKKNTHYGTPAETISRQKRARLTRAAEAYLAHSRMGDMPCRFDVIAIVGETIEHIVDAFRLEA